MILFSVNSNDSNADVLRDVEFSKGKEWNLLKRDRKNGEGILYDLRECDRSEAIWQSHYVKKSEMLCVSVGKWKSRDRIQSSNTRRFSDCKFIFLSFFFRSDVVHELWNGSIATLAILIFLLLLLSFIFKILYECIPKDYVHYVNTQQHVFFFKLNSCFQF